MLDITKTTLFSAEEICSKLSISRSTFDRWRKIQPGAKSPFGPTGGFQSAVLSELRSSSDIENEPIGLTPFPEPSLNVGGNPRWDANDVNAWLAENKDKKNRRGFRA